MVFLARLEVIFGSPRFVGRLLTMLVHVNKCEAPNPLRFDELARAHFVPHQMTYQQSGTMYQGDGYSTNQGVIYSQDQTTGQGQTVFVSSNNDQGYTTQTQSDAASKACCACCACCAGAACTAALCCCCKQALSSK